MTELILDLNYLHFPKEVEPWWQHPFWLPDILRVVAEAGLGIELRYLDEEPVESLDWLLIDCVSWDGGVHALASSPDSDAEATLHLTLLSNRMRLLLGLKPRLLAKVADPLGRLVDLIARLREVLGPEIQMGHSLVVRASGVEFPRPRPPRAAEGAPLGALVEVLSRSYYQGHEDASREELAKLLAAPLPVGASREEREDLIIFRFAASLEPAELRLGCSRHYRWRAAAIELPIAPGYNLQGDHVEARVGLVPHEPLTYYDPDLAHGYKATVVGAGGQVDEELFAEMAAWLKAGQLPDGTPLRALHLIVQSRMGALWVRPRASQVGIADVLYIGENNQLWDPFPPGPWLPGEG